MERPEIVTRTARHYLDELGIFHTINHPGVEQTLEAARENLQATVELSGGQRRPLLVDIRQIKSQTREARDYYTGPEGTRCFSAAAMLVDSPVSRLLGNFMIGFNKSSSVPGKLFSSEAEAIEWLKTFLD
ncbi:MAG TPA: hypothetical protein VF909_09480 [Roseiflexaceae bacterium]